MPPLVECRLDDLWCAIGLVVWPAVVWVVVSAAWVHREPPALAKAALFCVMALAGSAVMALILALRRGPIRWDGRAAFLAVSGLLAITVPGFLVAYSVFLMIWASRRLLRP
jgi:hypothetical protein